MNMVRFLGAAGISADLRDGEAPLQTRAALCQLRLTAKHCRPGAQTADIYFSQLEVSDQGAGRFLPGEERKPAFPVLLLRVLIPSGGFHPVTSSEPH